MRAFLVAVAALLLAACGRPAFNNVDITGVNYANDFALTDHAGARRTLADYRGKLVVIFFGYTQCPDVCPTTMQEMTEVRRALGSDAERVQVLFVTIDPRRDTPEVLAQYVPGFDPSFVGLYGSDEEIARTAKQFKVFYQKVPGKTETSYTMDHTAGSYVIDASGQPRLFLKHNQGTAPIVADLKQLLR
jgi:protein SCO1/2